MNVPFHGGPVELDGIGEIDFSDYGEVGAVPSAGK